MYSGEIGGPAAFERRKALFDEMLSVYGYLEGYFLKIGPQSLIQKER
jgi:hypothetical protein